VGQTPRSGEMVVDPTITHQEITTNVPKTTLTLAPDPTNPIPIGGPSVGTPPIIAPPTAVPGKASGAAGSSRVPTPPKGLTTNPIGLNKDDWSEGFQHTGMSDTDASLADTIGRTHWQPSKPQAKTPSGTPRPNPIRLGPTSHDEPSQSAVDASLDNLMSRHVHWQPFPDKASQPVVSKATDTFTAAPEDGSVPNNWDRILGLARGSKWVKKLDQLHPHLDPDVRRSVEIHQILHQNGLGNDDFPDEF